MNPCVIRFNHMEINKSHGKNKSCEINESRPKVTKNNI